MVNQHQNKKIKMVVPMESEKKKKKKKMLELEPQQGQHAITAGRHIGLSACHRSGTPSKSQY